jgi:hypothetical protein
MRQANFMKFALVMPANGSSAFGNFGHKLSATAIRPTVPDAIGCAWHSDHDVVAMSLNEDVFGHAERL